MRFSKTSQTFDVPLFTTISNTETRWEFSALLIKNTECTRNVRNVPDWSK